MRKIIFTIILVTSIISLPGDAVFGQGWNVEMESILIGWDDAESVDIQGDYAYVSTNISGLRIVDISQPVPEYLFTFLFFENFAGTN